MDNPDSENMNFQKNSFKCVLQGHRNLPPGANNPGHKQNNNIHKKANKKASFIVMRLSLSL